VSVRRCEMKKSFKVLPAFVLLLMPVICNAQKLGQVACPKQDGYVYLYSSMTTLEIRATLKCGQQVQILDRSDNFVRVMTDKGEDGFVAADSLLFVKTTPAAKAAAARGKQKQQGAAAHGDASARGGASLAPAPPREIILARQTPVRLKLGRELSSATAHVGDEVNFEVSQDVIVGGVTVIAKGSPAIGAVTVAEPKKRMGKAGKLDVAVNSVVLGNNEKIILRSFGIEQSAVQKSGRNIPLLRGKDVTLAKDTEIIAYVDSDLHLKAAGFAAARTATQALSQSDAAKPRN
jgi:hypothetical protein